MAKQEPYSWEAYRGLLSVSCSEAEECAAVRSGLLASGMPSPPSATAKGARVRGRIQEMADGWVTDEDIRLMKHAVSSVDRNHFSADIGTADNVAWGGLVLLGLATRAMHNSGSGRSVYMVTPLGRAVLWAREHGKDGGR